MRLSHLINEPNHHIVLDLGGFKFRYKYFDSALKGKNSLNAVYALKYSDLENKHLDANLIKIGL